MLFLESPLKTCSPLWIRCTGWKKTKRCSHAALGMDCLGKAAVVPAPGYPHCPCCRSHTCMGGSSAIRSHSSCWAAPVCSRESWEVTKSHEMMPCCCQQKRLSTPAHCRGTLSHMLIWLLILPDAKPVQFTELAENKSRNKWIEEKLIPAGILR